MDRVVRHLVFWVIYCTYFYIQSLAPRTIAEFGNSDTYYFAWLNLCCFGPVFIFAVYFSIYYLLPKTLADKKYALFLFYFLLLYATGSYVNYFMAGIFLSHVHYSTPVENNFRHRIEFGNYNTRWGMVIAIIAIGIKLTKTWYLQQKENLEILKKKNRTAIQLQKARLHPDFLLRSLDTIYTNIQSGSGKAPSIILNLSDLLSYSLYENGKELVPLEREIGQLNNFIALEQQGKAGTINMHLQTGSVTNSLYIVPLVIIKILEETTALLHTREQTVCLQTLQVATEKNQVSITLLIHPLYNEPGGIPNWSYIVENTQRRLLEYYSPNDFQIDLSENEQETGLRLHLTLADAPGMQAPAFNINTKTVAYDRV
ncbi:histidine kinase [Niastella vici]|nr:histidine kinase [Niastella vici]